MLRVRRLSVFWCMFSHMARKQTRRSVSINRSNYEAAKKAAASRGMTITGLVEFALGAVGVPIVSHPQQSPELVRATAVRRAASMQAASMRAARGDALARETAR